MFCHNTDMAASTGHALPFGLAILLTFMQLLPFCFSSTRLWNSTIMVSVGGTDKPTCGSTDIPCSSFDFAVQQALRKGMNSTRIFLKRGSYELMDSYIFTSVQDFAIEGDSTGEVKITCRKTDVSLAFILSENIQLSNVKLVQCGGGQTAVVSQDKITLKTTQVKFITALYFNYCKNLQMTNVEVSRSRGLAVTLCDVSGINVSRSVFSDNVPRLITPPAEKVNNSNWFILKDNSNASTGGGIFLALNSYGYNPVNISHEMHESYVQNNTYHFSDLRFLRNEAQKPGIKDYMNTPEVPFSRGGGLSISIFGNASGNTIHVTRCTFDGNKAQWGGGLQVEFKHVTSGNRVEVRDSIFTENYANFAGGGARVGEITISQTVLKPNSLSFQDCLFTNNTSIWGGGISLYGTSRIKEIGTEHTSSAKRFVFKSCRWNNNSGTVGSAIGAYLFNLNTDNIGTFSTFHVELDVCDIVNNNVITQGHDVVIGHGAVYSVQVPLILKGDVNIINNTNTAMVLDGASAEIYGRVKFIENKGFRGGALAMYGRSKLQLAKNSRVVFQENECEDKGGALYVNAPGSPHVSFNATGSNIQTCFFGFIGEENIDFDFWDTEVIFRGNKAPDEALGPSVYATTLKNCRRAGETKGKNSALQWNFIKFLDARGQKQSNVNREVSTDPINICYNVSDWQVAPSEVFNASVTLLDEKGNPVYGIVKVDVKGADDSASVRLATASSLFVVHNRLSFLVLTGKEGDRFTVSLRYMGETVVRREIKGLALKACNPGFKSSRDQCICYSKTFPGISRCGKDGRSVYLKRGYWAGLVSGKFHTMHCPNGYCRCPNRSILVEECLYVRGQMCKGGRSESSILCGSCKAGYTTTFGSEKCSKDCSNWNLLFFVLIALVLIGVVMFIMLINLDVFTGYLNAWLYSYQVITLLIKPGFKFDAFMKFVIGIANLQLRAGSEGSCFAAGLDEADKMAIMYVLPTYILLLVFILAKCVRRFPNWCFSRRVKAPFRAFCTIFVLCYTNITGISLKILHPAILGDKMVLFQQGEVEFFRGKHIAYVLLAIVYIMVIVVPFPLLLMYQSFFARCLRPVVNIHNFKPLFDRLQGCFKDQYRWCAAFYFVSRLVVLMVATYAPESAIKRALLETLCIVILVIFVYLRPYKEGKGEGTNYNWINVSDAVLLTNLSLLTVFSSTIDESAAIDTKTSLRVLVNCLAYVPLIVLAVVVYIVAAKHYKKHQAAQTNCTFSFVPKSPPKNESDFSDVTEYDTEGNPRASAASYY